MLANSPWILSLCDSGQSRGPGQAEAVETAVEGELSEIDRLADQSVQSIETSSLHLDIISDMRRINSFFCSTAYPILEQAGQLRKSRLRSAAAPDATGAFAKGDLAARPK